MARLKQSSPFFSNTLSSQSNTISINDLPVMHIKTDERLLVFAPHPDDEVLGGGGVIAATAAQFPNNAVRVVVATNGDGSRLSAIAQKKSPFSPTGMRQLADKRQYESLSALIYLGLHSDQIEYWGFPDGGLRQIWKNSWESSTEYQSPTTGYSSNQQSKNCLPVAYTSLGLMKLLLRCLSTFRPTTIIMPHPLDAHPDHLAMAHFIALAATIYSLEKQISPPAMLAYPVWMRTRPLPVSVTLRTGQLKLPQRFNGPFCNWVRFPLTPAIQKKKQAALACYKSQKWSAGAILADSAQSDSEVFDIIPPNSVFPPFTTIAIPDAATGHTSSYGTFIKWVQARLSL